MMALHPTKSYLDQLQKSLRIDKIVPKTLREILIEWCAIEFGARWLDFDFDQLSDDELK